MKLLADKKLLRKCFTQNIDTLERRAGVPTDKVVEAHGSFATHRCIECKTPFSDEEMKRVVEAGTIPHCVQCDGLVKPDIVFFGEAVSLLIVNCIDPSSEQASQLPEIFHRSLPALQLADLLIVIGTSLVVHPFASLVDMVPPECPRVLINMEPAGGIGRKKNDLELLGKCDEIIRQLADELGWGDELDNAWAATAESVEMAERSAGDQANGPATDQELMDEVAKLANEIEASLTVKVDELVAQSSRGDNVGSSAESHTLKDREVHEEGDVSVPQKDQPQEEGHGDQKEDSAADVKVSCYT